MLDLRRLVLGVTSKTVKYLEHILEPLLLSPSSGDTITTRSSTMPGGYVQNTELCKRILQEIRVCITATDGQRLVAEVLDLGR